MIRPTDLPPSPMSSYWTGADQTGDSGFHRPKRSLSNSGDFLSMSRTRTSTEEGAREEGRWRRARFNLLSDRKKGSPPSLPPSLLSARSFSPSSAPFDIDSLKHFPYRSPLFVLCPAVVSLSPLSSSLLSRSVATRKKTRH